MTQTPTFDVGDVVVHPRRPEWGEGRILRAIRLEKDGKIGQRLTIRFGNKGEMTINTLMAPLMSKGTFDQMTSSPAPSKGADWPGQADDARKRLAALPEALTDPFASLAKRLDATLHSFRFGVSSSDGKALLDWAVGQTGMTDPMTKFTRHEIEQAFELFLRDRDRHLVDLVRQAKKDGKTPLLQDAAAQAKAPGARRALEAAMRR